jgi:hypothetical protein
VQEIRYLNRVCGNCVGTSCQCSLSWTSLWPKAEELAGKFMRNGLIMLLGRAVILAWEPGRSMPAVSCTPLLQDVHTLEYGQVVEGCGC